MSYQWSDFAFLVGFVTYLWIRGIFIERTRSNEIESRWYGWLERVLFALVFVGNLLLPIVYLVTPWLRFAEQPLPLLAPVCGVPLMAAALWLFWRAHVDLGNNWSSTLEIRKDHQLVMHGVYQRIRHPMYAAILLFGLAQGLMLSNWLAGWSALGSFIILYLARFPREEAMLSDRFGSAYQDYKQRTGRLIPRFLPGSSTARI